MTVIRGKKNYNFSKPGSSTAASDTESLHLDSASASDTESYNEPNTNPNRIFRSLPVRPLCGEDSIYLKKSSGKKKLRRFQNRCVLQTLSEEDEDSNSMVVMEAYKSPFARLLEDVDAMKYWNMFIEKTEEEQENIINAFSKQCNKSDDNPKCNNNNTGKISSRVKRTLKIKKNLSLDVIKCCEDDMLLFFHTTPTDKYIRSPNNSFERLLIKAVAHYHGLEIKNILPSSANLKPSVEIFNTNDNWVPAKCFLTDFIKQLR